MYIFENFSLIHRGRSGYKDKDELNGYLHDVERRMIDVYFVIEADRSGYIYKFIHCISSLLYYQRHVQLILLFAFVFYRYI